MNLYHASFKGRRSTQHDKPLTRIGVVLTADSIYDVRGRLDERYEFITGLCVTNCEAAGITMVEISNNG